MKKIRPGQGRSRALRPRPEEMAVELEQALKNFSSAPAFFMLQSLKVAPLFPSGKIGAAALEQSSFGDLVSLGARVVLSAKGLTGAKVRHLVKLLEDLAGDRVGAWVGETAAQESAADQRPDSGVVPEEAEGELLAHIVAAGNKAAPRRGAAPSIESERILREAFLRLQNSNCFEQIKDVPLEKYWPKAGLHDPFLEALSFRQICGIKVSQILEKHSFNDRKLEQIVKTIDACLSENGDGAVHAPMTAGATAAMSWLPSERTLPGFAQGILSHYELQCRAAYSLGKEMADLIVGIPAILSKEQLVALWLLGDSDEEAVANILKFEIQGFSEFQCLAAQRVRALFETVAASMHAHWQVALCTPGVSLNLLLSPYLLPGVDVEFQVGFARVLLRAIGAVHPVVKGVPLPGYWCREAALLEAVLIGLINRSSGERPDWERACGAALPLISSADLAPLLGKLCP